MKISCLWTLCLSMVLVCGTAAQDSSTVSDTQKEAIAAIEKCGGRLIRSRQKTTIVMLADTQVTDADLVHLKALPEMTQLSLNRTTITDEGLVHLRELSALRSVSLADTRVTDEGVAKLQEALPNCRIIRTNQPPAGTRLRNASPQRTPSSVTSFGTSTLNLAQVINLESVRAELALTEEQRTSIDTLLTAWTKREDERARRLTNSPSREEGVAALSDARQDGDSTWASIRQLLTAAQNERFDQLRLQRSGFRNFVFLPRELTVALQLTSEQQTRFRGIYADWERAFELPRAGTKTWDRLMLRFLDVLSDEQREQWGRMMGEPFDFSVPAPARGRAMFASTYTYPNLGRDARWLTSDRIQSELKFTEAQAQEILDLDRQWKEKFDAMDQMLRALPKLQMDPHAIRKAGLELADSAVEITDRMTSVLTPDQKTRLQQLQLQQRGWSALVEPTEHPVLDLTPRQTSQLNLLWREAGPTLAAGRPAQPRDQESRDALADKALEILTEEQRQQWCDALGDPFEFPESAPGNRL